jgi:hypothetical protein
VGTDSIDMAIERMDRLLARAVEDDDPRGYFTAVYRAVTARIRDGIVDGEFADGERMERFDVRFANLYLDAVEAHDRGGDVSASWRTAFDAAGHPLLVLQHVLLGMNAHINLDLGVAAARTAPGAELTSLRDDFEAVNDVLATMVDRMQDALAVVSPWTGVLDRAGMRLDEAVTAWSLHTARARAWDFAGELAAVEDQDALVRARDEAVAGWAGRILRPGVPARWVVAAARRGERLDVGAVMTALAERGAPVLPD